LALLNKDIHEAYELSFSKVYFSVSEAKINELKKKESQQILVGQERAISALELGFSIDTEGYNIFIMGAPGTGRKTILSTILKKYKPTKDKLQDIAYVYNYHHPLEPAVLFFPAGEGKKFKKILKHAIDTIYRQAQEIVKSEFFLSEQKKIISAVDSEENSLVSDFEIKMLSRGFKLLQVKDDNNQIDLIPIIKGKEVSFFELQGRVSRKKFSEKVFNELREKYYHSLDELTELFSLLQKKRKDSEDMLKKLHIKILQPIITKELLGVYELIEKYPIQIELQKNYNKKIKEFLKKTEKDLIDRSEFYMTPFKSIRQKKVFFGRYEINIISENLDNNSCIVDEHVPSFSNLFGTIETYGDDENSFVNAHLHIRGGAVHHAFGGVLILKLADLLEEEDSWIYLKRMLQSGKIEIQSYATANHNHSAFKPEPIPAHLKVVIIGGEYTYEILYQEDPDFYKLFKICAEFDSILPYNDENLAAVLSLINTFIKKHATLPFDNSGYAALLSYAVQLSGSRHYISAQFTKISDFVIEANSIAIKDNKNSIDANIIRKTIEQRYYISSLPEIKFMEMMKFKEVFIDTSGVIIGKINGLAVEERGFHSFGIPVSITAQASPGTTGIINIEREAGLSGEIYNKAHFIISSLLRQRYAMHFPLSISATICFEQSYNTIDGDSASCAEFFALLSAIGNIPLRQDIAVTGSLNQLGIVQPVGGISEKITGFFDTCSILGLTGTQGVMIPFVNQDNLFLPDRVLKAIEKKLFKIWVIRSIDEGIQLLSGKNIDAVNSIISAALESFAKTVKAFTT